MKAVKRQIIITLFSGLMSLSFLCADEKPVPSVEKLSPFKAVPNTEKISPQGTWTLVVMPDTQCYAEYYPAVFPRQTQWIVQNKDARNILFVVHEGDIVNAGKNPRKEWAVAQKSMRILNEGKMPYALLPGNHDLGLRPTFHADTRDTLLNE